MCPVYPSAPPWGYALLAGIKGGRSAASIRSQPNGRILGEGLTINGLRYSGSCPFPQTPIPLRFFDVPYTYFFNIRSWL